MIFPNLKELIRLKKYVGVAGSLQTSSQNRTQGNYTSIFHGLGVEFETVRPYVIGDDVRYIDWRVTARIGEPQVKTFRDECDRNVLIMVDANAYMRFGTKGTFKSVQAAKTAALLAWKSLDVQDRVGGLVFGDIDRGMQYFKPDKHNTAVLRMLHLLCNGQTNKNTPVSVANAMRHAVNMITPQSLVFVISDFSCDDMELLEKAMSSLARKCTLVLIPIYDQADTDIPAIGQLVLEGDNTNCTINTNDRKARQAYKDAWEAYKNRLQSMSKKLRAPIIWIETCIDPIKSLFVIKQAIRDGRFN